MMLCRIYMIQYSICDYNFALITTTKFSKMVTINPYLNFSGNTEKAMTFYKSIFGGEFNVVHKFKDMPGGNKIGDDDQQKIMHMSLPIGNSNHLLASDIVESMGQTLTMGTNFTLTAVTESEMEADKIFNALAQGGQITMAMNKAFWGAYVGFVTDKFGIQWMITCDSKK
jgi:PhnB protein